MLVPRFELLFKLGECQHNAKTLDSDSCLVSDSDSEPAVRTMNLAEFQISSADESLLYSI